MPDGRIKNEAAVKRQIVRARQQQFRRFQPNPTVTVDPVSFWGGSLYGEQIRIRRGACPRRPF